MNKNDYVIDKMYDDGKFCEKCGKKNTLIHHGFDRDTGKKSMERECTNSQCHVGAVGNKSRKQRDCSGHEYSGNIFGDRNCKKCGERKFDFSAC